MVVEGGVGGMFCLVIDLAAVGVGEGVGTDLVWVDWCSSTTCTGAGTRCPTG